MDGWDTRNDLSKIISNDSDPFIRNILVWNIVVIEEEYIEMGTWAQLVYLMAMESNKNPNKPHYEIGKRIFLSYRDLFDYWLISPDFKKVLDKYTIGPSDKMNMGLAKGLASKEVIKQLLCSDSVVLVLIAQYLYFMNRYYYYFNTVSIPYDIKIPIFDDLSQLS